MSDPTKFTHQLDDAVGEYVTTLRQLSAQAPARLRPGLDRVSADVQQYRFADARTDRADLDDYAATACGRHPADTDTSTTAPTAPTTTTTSVSTPGG